MTGHLPYCFNNMKNPFSSGCPALAAFTLLALLFCGVAVTAAPVVIIKADDFRGPSQKWTDFLDVSRKAGIKVSIGAIADSIAGNDEAAKWMKAQETHGDVEFWDHGWDHKALTNKGGTVTEFGGSGVAYQREHFAKAQAALKTAAGCDMTTFGTPYNAFDADTATVINETPAIRVFFTHNVTQAKKLLNPRVTVIDVISESEGTGKPNADKFEAMWADKSASYDVVSLQFHPPYFTDDRLAEYGKIIDFLKAQGCSIKLPSECVGN